MKQLKPHSRKHIRLLSTVTLAFIFILLNSCGSEKFNDSSHGYQTRGQEILVTDHQVTYVIEPYASGMVRISAIEDTAGFSYEPTIMTQLEPASEVDFQVREYSDKLKIETNDLELVVTKEPFEIQFYDKNELALTTFKGLETNQQKKTALFACDTTEAFFGMGQKGIPVNRRGYSFDTRNEHVGGYTKPYATMQVNIPYVYTSNNYGIFFDNTYTGFFDLADNKNDEWSYQADGGEMTFYFVGGDDLQSLQTGYYELTGYPTLPPKWTLGMLQSKCGYIDENEVNNVVDTFKDLDLPLDAIILDAYWFGGYGDDYPQLMGNFTWYDEHFPNPEEYMARLKKQGIKTLTINEPQINVGSENHQMLVDKGWLMEIDGEPYIQESFWAGSASLLDLTNANARDWLWSKQKANVELGLDAFWVDLTEPDVSDPDGVFHGGPEPKIHNIYSSLFAKTLWDGFQEDYPNRRLFNVTRAGTAGIHRFGAVHWSGDASKTFEALELQIPMLIGASMSGMPHYSSDIGGFTNAWDTIEVAFQDYEGGKGVTSPELYTRWFQFGVFSPSLRPHSGEDQSCEPFAFDPKTLDITSDYLDIRYQLIPYLYTYAHKTATTGEQLVKPLFMYFDEPELIDNDREYMFGDLLIAPVFKDKQRKREVYLPENNGLKWIDFWDNTEYDGGQTVTVDAPLDRIPVFAKGGSIIPLAKVKKYIDEFPDTVMTLKIYPGQDGAFELYEDDGTSKGYTREEYATTRVTCEESPEDITITVHEMEGDYPGKIETRTWEFVVHQVSGVNTVTINGETIPANHYEYDEQSGILKIAHEQSTEDALTLRIE